MAKIKKKKVYKRIYTKIEKQEFYAEFGIRMLYVVGCELEKFYKFTNKLTNDTKWNAKEKKDIEFMISVFKTCNGANYGLDNECSERWEKDVNKAIGLSKKYWFTLWN